MKLFEVSDLQQTRITNVNVRKEHYGEDERVTAIDLVVVAESVTIPFVAHLLEVEDDEKLKQALWEPSGKLIMTNIKPLQSSAQFENKYQVSLPDADRNLLEDRVDKVCKFKIQPKGGHVFDVTFRITISEPSEGILEAVVYHLDLRSVLLRLTPLPDLFDKDDEEGQEAA